MRILLTGDDGYYSIGTRLLIQALRDAYELQVVATKHQQSGVGGRLSLATGCQYGETTIDGVPALWVDGSPCDAMEFGVGYFAKPFDLIISGVNMGANVTTAVISSGTYSAVVRGLSTGFAPKGLAISWDAPAEMWYKPHDANADIFEYVKYPGQILRHLIEQCIKEDLWGAQLLNINLPKNPTEAVRVTKFHNHIPDYYTYPLRSDPEKKQFDYGGQRVSLKTNDPETDVVAVEGGVISVTPCSISMLDNKVYSDMKDIKII